MQLNPNNPASRPQLHYIQISPSLQLAPSSPSSCPLIALHPNLNNRVTYSQQPCILSTIARIQTPTTMQLTPKNPPPSSQDPKSCLKITCVFPPANLYLVSSTVHPAPNNCTPCPILVFTYMLQHHHEGAGLPGRPLISHLQWPTTQGLPGQG